MAAGSESNFVIYHNQFFGGMSEALAQFADAWNGASGNTLRLVTRQIRGDYEQESFIKFDDVIAYRDPTDTTSAATDQSIDQDQFISVKVPRRIGPVAQSYGAWKKIGSSLEEFSLIMGQRIGEQAAADYLNTSLLALDAALDNVSALDLGAVGHTLTTDDLVNALAKMGDRAPRVKAWVMHSKPWFDLVKDRISEKLFGEGDVVVYGGLPGTLGKAVIVTDSPALFHANGSATDTYSVLGLVEGAAVVTESEEQSIVTMPITGVENLIYRIQGEYGFNLGLKGFKWDTTSGGINPDDTSIGTGSNWDKVATSHKDCAGVRIEVR